MWLSTAAPLLSLLLLPLSLGGSASAAPLAEMLLALDRNSDGHVTLLELRRADAAALMRTLPLHPLESTYSRAKWRAIL